MFRNGGRTGVAMTAGFRWAIGSEGSHINQGKTPVLKETEINLKSAK